MNEWGHGQGDLLARGNPGTHTTIIHSCKIHSFIYLFPCYAFVKLIFLAVVHMKSHLCTHSRWSKPHISTPGLAGILQLRRFLKSGVVALDLAAADFPAICRAITEVLVARGAADQVTGHRLEELLQVSWACCGWCCLAYMTCAAPR